MRVPIALNPMRVVKRVLKFLSIFRLFYLIFSRSNISSDQKSISGTNITVLIENQNGHDYHKEKRPVKTELTHSQEVYLHSINIIF